jgi:hypothetical protein
MIYQLEFHWPVVRTAERVIENDNVRDCDNLKDQSGEYDLFLDAYDDFNLLDLENENNENIESLQEYAQPTDTDSAAVPKPVSPP